MSLPKPYLISANKNSLTVGWSRFDFSEQKACYLQYRMPSETWAYCQSIPIERGDSAVRSTLNNLQSRTPYYIRFVIFDRFGKVEDVGPQTVLDTADITTNDCATTGGVRNSTKEYVKKCASCFIDEVMCLSKCKNDSPNYKSAVV